jgi:transposase
MPKTFYLNDQHWSKLLDFFLSQSIYFGSPQRLRIFVEAVFWMLKSGAQWRLLPDCYGKWNSVYSRFNRWSKKGIWEALFKHCIQEPDLQEVMADTTVVRAHACSAGYRAGDQSLEGLGRSRGGFSSKIHFSTDALGNPLKIIVTEGNASDISCASALLNGYNATTIIADKAYDSNDLLIEGLLNGCTMEIPPKKNRNYQRKYDKNVYKERHLAECFVNKIKHFRRANALNVA